jgi:amino acid adenylation domain-containing protein
MSMLLQDALRRQAQARPEATAIVDGAAHITYGALERATNRLARCLNAAGCRNGDRVGILAPKSIAAVSGILATLKAGGIFVPLDPACPPPRLLAMIRSCGCRLILAAGPVQAVLAKLLAERVADEPIRVGWIDPGDPPAEALVSFTALDWNDAPDSAVPCQRRSEDVAHILFTSGSTGAPKGVMITHANVLAFLDWALPHFGHVPSDRISSHPPLHFDLSTFDIFGTLSAGAGLYLIPPSLSLMPQSIAEAIRSMELTQWFSVPSLLNYMARFDVVRFNDFPNLKRLLWCGEPFPTPALIYWMQRLPHVTFTNLYGPTEATIASSFYRVPACPASATDQIPIGRPCAGEELLVLHENLSAVGTGVVGDLYIRGAGLSPGYWNDPQKTMAAFLPDPFSSDPTSRIYRTGDLASVDEAGLVYLHGRADSQIKSRGYRIELGEIESVLQTIEGVRECVVTAVPTDGFEGHVICCAFVAVHGHELSPQWLRSRLREALPGSMIPTRWIRMDRLAVNGNGKIDRAGIRERFASDLAASRAGAKSA